LNNDGLLLSLLSSSKKTQMRKLNANWITEGLIDFEYKKYVLLAYLQNISKNFNSQKLYPFLSDLIYHFQNLTDIKEKTAISSNSFNHQLRKIDLDNFKMEYQKAIEENEFMDEIEAIVNFAIPEITKSLKDGKDIYEFVEEHLEIEPIGLLPLTTDFGYMLLKNGNKVDLKVFQYEITLFEKSHENYRAIKTNFITNFTKKRSNTYESFKLDLIKKVKSIPNPATFLVQSKFNFPLQETLLPIAKRSLVRFLADDLGQA